MKKILKDKIINVDGTDKFDQTFLFDVFLWDMQNQEDVKIYDLGEILKSKENQEMFEKAQNKPACYSNVYAPKDELEIFTELCDEAIKNKKRIHIVGITLGEEIAILENYYQELGFFKEEINCFDVDFSQVLVSASVKIENIMWRGSDYKRMGNKIFFHPPVRESGQVKALFKGINRGVVAGLYLHQTLTQNSPVAPSIKVDRLQFLSSQILEEKILPIILAKVLKCNLDNIGLQGESIEMKIEY